MNEPQAKEVRASPTVVGDDEINLIDWLIALGKRKVLVFGLPALFAACAALFSLTLPNIYKASTKILPSQQIESNVLSTLGQLSKAIGATQIESKTLATINQLGSFVGTTPGALRLQLSMDLYVSILKSNTVANDLIQRFDLEKAYGVKGMDAARQVLQTNSTIKFGKDDLITIDVQDKDPKRAAELANAYVDELIKMTKKLSLTQASYRRLFFERRLQSTRDNLAEAEAALKASATLPGAINADPRTRAAIETAANLRAQISAKETELGAMEAFVRIDNREFNRGQQEIGGMRAKLFQIEKDSPAVQKLTEQDGKLLGRDNIKLLHDVKYYQTLTELLKAQYEQARIEEAKDTSAIQVLDPALAPEHAYNPKRALIVVSAALFGLFVAIFWVLLFDVIRVGESLNRLRHAKN